MAELQPVKIARYGWRRDRPDPRDHIFNLERPVAARESQLPGEYDFASEMPAIFDQGQLGSCTANGVAAIMQHAQAEASEREGSEPSSRLFIYYEERRIEGSPLDQDTGAEVRDGIKVLVNEGAPPEAEWPYSDANPGPFQQRPPDSAFTDALQFRAVQYMRIVIPGPGYPMRSALAGHRPIVFGFPVPASFEDGSWNPATDLLPIPDEQTEYIGGHCCVVVGYDFTLRRFPHPAFKIRNSWGADWGDAGHFWMHYRWFDGSGQRADDLWVVESVT